MLRLAYQAIDPEPKAVKEEALGLTVFRAIKYDPPGLTACGVTCARTSS